MSPPVTLLDFVGLALALLGCALVVVLMFALAGYALIRQTMLKIGRRRP